MKFNESWLREWVDPPISTEQLSEQLTMAGFEVDELESTRPEFSHIVIAKVHSIAAHPNADKQKLCLVEDGSGENIEVVCGADNVREGAFYPFARVGATLPGGLQISESEIKGIISKGMLCSAAELGLSDEADRLMQLSDEGELKPGTALNEFLSVEDSIFELSLTPNRGDCLSLGGLAREVAVLNQLSVKEPAVQNPEAVNDITREIHLAAAESCPRYVGRVISDIDISRPSPTWLTEKLRRCGLRSINAVVDVSNYVMLELGQPTHAFDNDKLSGAITVRHAHAEEEITLLDEQSRTMSEDTLVIADEKGAVAMAGIMGGLATAVSDATRTIFLESAFFSPLAISGRARQFGMHTDASHRYERGVDYQLQRKAVERVSQLIVQICGGQPGPISEACSEQHLPKRHPVTLEYAELGRVLGKDICASEASTLLSRLGLSVTETAKGIQADIPSFRFDLAISEDLIEEIARLHGYQHIPSIAPRISLKMTQTDTELAIEHFRELLINRDYYEVISYSFVDQALQKVITGRDDAIALLNPISSDMGVMRQSLWPGLLQTLQYNLKRQQQRIRLFEYGLVFTQDKDISQIPVLAGLIYGETTKKQWDKEYTSCDYFDLKGDVETLLSLQNRVVEADYRRIDDIALHPGQSAEIIIDNQRVGKLGAVHPAVLQQLDIEQPVYVFELQYEKISSKKQPKFTKISKFPSTRRDISILVNRDVTVAELMNCIRNASSEHLYNLELFDVYQGEGIDLEKKSLALGLTFQGSSSTLTDEEVEGMLAKLLDILYSEFGAALRE